MIYKSVPTFNSETKEWTYTNFETREEFKKFVWSKFKKPGELKLKNIWAWRQEASKYERDGSYDLNMVTRSADYVAHWNFEKEKCTEGVIVDDFYLTRYYYFWLNYLPINDKRINKLVFPNIWDSQYYFFLYEMLCELEYKYSVIVKKRQWGSTFQHLAILLNDVWFETGFINKVAAYDEEYLIADWAIMEEYRTFLNTHTAWYRPFNPDKTLNWQQRWEVKKGGRKSYVGNSSILKGLNMKASASKGVGGKNNKFYYEEAGITKTMIKTFGYIDPALKLGALTTGMFMAGGSVGELEQCEDLKAMAFKPNGFNILPVKNDFENEGGSEDICFFVPEYWSMPPYIDKNGNSIINTPTEEESEWLKQHIDEYPNIDPNVGSKDWCIQERERIKETMPPEGYRMYVSQHPFDLSEAFAWRAESVFPQDLILKQQERIREKNNYGTSVTLEYDSNGNIIPRITDDIPIQHFPVSERDNKKGTVVVYEYPEPNPKWMTYFAGIDPVMIGKTTTSTSLFSIYIFRNLTERIYEEKGEQKLKVDGYKIVASYVGRYDDLKNTNKIAEMLLVWYNALAAVENNVMSFINHMQERGLQKHLATKDQLSFVSELKTNLNVYCPYGFKTNETIRGYFIDIVFEYISEKLDVIKKKGTDEVVKTLYGIERIPDLMLLEELRQYHDKLNVDRFIAFAAGLALMKAYKKSNLGILRIDETKKEEPKIDYEVKKSFFRNYGYENSVPLENKIKRTYFKNYV